MEPLPPAQMTKKGQKRPKRAKNGSKWKNGPKIGSGRHLGPRDPPILTPHPFYPNFKGSGPIWSSYPHPNGQKGSKKAQKGPKWLKMTKNGPQRGSGRHLGPRDHSPPHFTPTLGGSGPTWSRYPHPNGQKGSKKAQNGQKWLKMAKNGPKIGSRCHLGPRDPPILTPRPILRQL